jgi:hypothetical protein
VVVEVLGQEALRLVVVVAVQVLLFCPFQLQTTLAQLQVALLLQQVGFIQSLNTHLQGVIQHDY